MLIEAALLPRNLSSVSVRTSVIPFNYGSGSAKAKSYGSATPESIQVKNVRWRRCITLNRYTSMPASDTDKRLKKYQLGELTVRYHEFT